MPTEVTVTGPLFDGRAERAVRAYCDDAEREIAEQGDNDVHAMLGAVLRNPTGRYQSRVHTDRQAGDSVITDGGALWGAWLEGVAHRNAASRFKGYRTFRKVSQRLQARAAGIGDRVLQRHIGRLQ